MVDKLDEGFEEVSLDDGFQEVSLDEGFEEIVPEPIKAVTEEPSQLEALGRGGLQGVTMGTSEELGALLTSPVDYIREQNRLATETAGMEQIQSDLVNKLTLKRDYALQKGDTEKADKIQKMIEKETGTPFKPEEAASFGEIYRERRDLGRQADIAAKEAHPWTYGAGEVAGGAVTAVAGGLAGGVTKAAMRELVKQGGKKAVLKELAKQGVKEGAIFGALQEAGLSEADLTEGEFADFATDVAKGTVIGGGVGAALPLARPALKVAKSGLRTVGKGVKAVGTGLKELAENPAEKAARKALGESAEAVAKGKKDTAYNRSGEGIKELIDSYKVAKKGDEFVGTGLAKGELAEEIVDTHGENTINLIREFREELAKPKVEKALSRKGNKIVNITDDLTSDINKLERNLTEITDQASESYRNGARVLEVMKNQRDMFMNELSDVVKSIPTTKSQAYNKLHRKISDIIAKNEAGTHDLKAVDNLFKKVAKKYKGGEQPTIEELQRVALDFGLDDVNQARYFARDIFEMKVQEPVFDKVTGEMKTIPKSYVEVVKKYMPSDIFETEVAGVPKLGFRQGPKTVFESYRPEPSFKGAGIEAGPQELFDIQKSIREAIPTEKGNMRQLLSEMGDKYRGILEDQAISDENKALFKEAMDIYQKTYRLQDLTGIKSAFDPLAMEEARSQAGKFVTRLEPQKILAPEEDVALNQVRKIMNELKPGSGDELFEAGGEAARKRTLAERAAGSGTTPFVSPTASPQTQAAQATSFFKSIPIRAGEAAGKISRKVKAVGEIPGNMIQNIKNLTNEQLATIAQKSRSQGNDQVANFLENVARTESSTRKQALLFTASQKPEIRQYIAEELGWEEE